MGHQSGRFFAVGLRSAVANYLVPRRNRERRRGDDYSTRIGRCSHRARARLTVWPLAWWVVGVRSRGHGARLTLVLLVLRFEFVGLLPPDGY